MKEINSYGFNMADDTRKVRVEERLKIKIGTYCLFLFWLGLFAFGRCFSVPGQRQGARARPRPLRMLLSFAVMNRWWRDFWLFPRQLFLKQPRALWD